MADSHTGASVVVVDPVKAAEERNRLARAQLSDAAPSTRSLVVLKGLTLTVPWTLKYVVNGQKETPEALKAKAQAILDGCFKECDEALNNFNPKSEVSRLNRQPVNQPFQMSEALTYVLRTAMQVTNATGGAYDPCCGAVAAYLKEFALRNNGNTPPANDERFKVLVAGSHFVQSFVTDFNKRTITKRIAEAQLDLGGISKGFTVDSVIEKLVAAGFKDAMFDWGGDCRAIGRNTRNEHWAVAIIRPPSLEDLSHPKETGKKGDAAEERPLIKVCRLDNEAIATSGDYENLLPNIKPLTSTIYDGKNQTLLRPSLDAVAQVSVKNWSCMVADALSTAALVKRDLATIRYTLDNWRYTRFAVTDYTAYLRNGERVAKMYEVAKESKEMRDQRIASSLPARVIVVGGGLAGCCAAIEAVSSGASVILIEKEAKLGGNSAKATSGINGWGTRAQGSKDVIDSGKFFERDTHLSGKGGQTDHGLVSVLSVKSGEAIEWLTKKFGLPLTVISQLGGHSRPRTHRAPDMPDGTPVPIGYTIMQYLIQHITTTLSNRVTVMTNTSVEKLLHESHETADGTMRTRVYGVLYRAPDSPDPIKLSADAVILASGGYGNDRTDSSLLRQYAPHLAKVPTTNGAFATGDGVKMAKAAGATLSDMDKVQLHPTGLIDPKDPANATKYLGPEALRGSGGILINKRGKRFINELDLRSVVAKGIQSQNDIYPDSNGAPFAFCVLNSAAKTLFGPRSLGFYKDKLGLFQEVADLDGLAALTGAPKDVLRATLEQYEATSAAKKRCPITGKSVFPCVIGPQGPFVVACITPSIHYTMGGIAISPSAEVQASVGHEGLLGRRRPIRGLFAAGEVSSGVHGANRLGGNSLLECVVFGRIAGDRAATILQQRPTALSFDKWCTVVLREVRHGGSFGQGSKILRFNFPGSLQVSGIKLGQFVAIRGEWDGQQLVGYYSPITLPDDIGVIGLLCRVDKGNLAEWVNALRPGDAVEMKAFGGLAIDRSPSQRCFMFEGNAIRRIGMIAGGAGVAPMLQILRAALKDPYRENIDSLRLLYAAEEESELTYKDTIRNFEQQSSRKFRCHLVLNNPPPGWMEGVGFIDRGVLAAHIQPPSDDLLIAICGPPIMQRIVRSHLLRIGHDPSRVRTVDEQPVVSKI